MKAATLLALALLAGCGQSATRATASAATVTPTDCSAPSPVATPAPAIVGSIQCGMTFITKAGQAYQVDLLGQNPTVAVADGSYSVWINLMPCNYVILDGVASAPSNWNW